MNEIEIKPLEELPDLDENNTPEPFMIEANIYSNNNLNYEDFFNNHMRKNIPCIIKNISTDWESTEKWVRGDQINCEYMLNQYGSIKVPIIDCNNSRFDRQDRSEMMLSEYINYWESTTRDKMLYLKDWHLKRSRPDDIFYIVPKWFASDWLNEYAQDKVEDDFMFVYVGPKGSWTPMHADVYNSFSWSVNVTGRKKWFLFPPGEEKKLKDKFKNLIMHFDPEKHKDRDAIYYEIIQEKGDGIFVPSGWYHQVENEIDTVSVNHNWVNGCNITNVWQDLTSTLRSVEQEIDELKDLPEFPSTCQNMLKLMYGMNCAGFQDLVTHIGEKRLLQLEGGSNIGLDGYTLGKNHMMYDLKRIHEVCNFMIQHYTYLNNHFTITENFIALQDSLTYLF